MREGEAKNKRIDRRVIPREGERITISSNSAEIPSGEEEASDSYKHIVVQCIIVARSCGEYCKERISPLSCAREREREDTLNYERARCACVCV